MKQKRTYQDLNNEVACHCCGKMGKYAIDILLFEFDGKVFILCKDCLKRLGIIIEDFINNQESFVED